MLPPFYIFDSEATIIENQKIKMKWLENLPVVKVKFGCKTMQVISPFVAVTPSGSMTEEHFYEYLDQHVEVATLQTCTEQMQMEKCYLPSISLILK